MAYLFVSSLGGVPCDGLTGDGVWWFPECMSYPPPFSLLYGELYILLLQCFHSSITGRTAISAEIDGLASDA